MKTVLLFNFFFLFVLASCNRPSTVVFPVVKNVNPNIQMEDIETVPVTCDPIEASYVGAVHWSNDSLFYIDEEFCALFSTMPGSL